MFSQSLHDISRALCLGSTSGLTSEGTSLCGLERIMLGIQRHLFCANGQDPQRRSGIPLGLRASNCGSMKACPPHHLEKQQSSAA